MKDYKEPNHEGNDNEEIKCHMLDHNFVTDRGDCNNQGGRISPL